MKTYLKTCCFLSFLFLVVELKAQSSKTGVIDRQHINQVLTTSNIKQLELTKSEKQLYEEIETYGRIKLQANTKVVTPNIDSESQEFFDRVTAKRKELVFRKDELQRIQNENIKVATKLIAKEKGYTIIIDIQHAPYYSNDDNITDLVLKQLMVN